MSGIFGGYIIGLLSLWVMTIYVGEFMQAFSISEDKIGLLYALEAGGIALVSLYFAYQAGIQSLKKLAYTGLILALTGHGLSLFTDTFWIFALCRGLAGIGEGMALVAANTAGAAHKNPERSFALAQLCVVVCVAILIFTVPHLSATYGYRTAIGAMLLVLIISIPLVAMLPGNRVIEHEGSDEKGHFPYPALGIAILSAFILLNFSDMGVWVFSEQIGLKAGLNIESISTILGATTFIGMVGPLLAAIISNRFGRLLPVTVGLLLLSSGGLMSVYATNAGTYGAGMITLVCCIGFLFPYFLGALASLDEKGSWTTLSGSVMAFAMAIAPLFTGLIATHGSYYIIGWFTFSCSMLALIIMVLVTRAMKKTQGLAEAQVVAA